MTQLWADCLCLVVLACAAITHVARAADPESFREANRPQFHYTPAKNWMNDPNGLVFFDGEWHLFHQYNPEGDTWGHMSWAHAVSRDLVHWTHLPVALAEANGVMIFSGSAVVDEKNTSGFGGEGKLPLVAIYTGHTPQKQTQDIACSTDRGRTWTKFPGNPVIDEGLKDFRDPKVFWHDASNAWVMAVALPNRHKVRFYTSADLKRWQQRGEFGPAGATGGVWECPDLFPLTVGAGGGRTRWVMTVGVSGGAPAGGNGTQYFVGDFDGRTFVSENPKELALWADHGPDFYAAQSWSNVPAADGRRIFIGWMTNFRYAPHEPTRPWRGTQSLPRELKLVETPAGLRLAQSPVREFSRLRDSELSSGDFSTAGQQLEIEAELDEATDAEFAVCVGADSRTVIGHDAARREIFVDRTRSRPGKPFHADFPGRFAAPVASRGDDGKIRIRVFVDRTSVELFADGGASVITANTFPAADAVALTPPPAGMKSFKVWRLRSIWKPKE
jgi:fructan beta-fructosidase